MRPCWRDLLLRRQAGLPVMTARDDDRSPIYATVRLEAIYATALRSCLFLFELAGAARTNHRSSHCVSLVILVTAASRRDVSVVDG